MNWTFLVSDMWRVGLGLASLAPYKVDISISDQRKKRSLWKKFWPLGGP